VETKDIIEIISMVLGVGGAILTSYIKLKDQISELKAEQRMVKVITENNAKDVKTVQRDIHNIALIIGTKRAIAEEQTKGEK
jgi:hypothetical protein